jgi:hypothetical protein
MERRVKRRIASLGSIMSLVRGREERGVVEGQEVGGCVAPLTFTAHHTSSQVSEEEQEQV